MPYAWQIAGDAKADLRELDIWLQEHVLDEFERVSANPHLLRVDPRGYGVHDFERSSGAKSHVVFVSLHCDHVRQVLSVLGIAELVRDS